MKTYYFFLKSNLGIDAFSNKIEAIICDIFFTNSKLFSTKRFGINYGGEYYSYENSNWEICLIQNKGETIILEYNMYEYYLFFKRVNESINMSLIETQLSSLFNNNQISNLMYIETTI